MAESEKTRDVKLVLLFLILVFAFAGVLSPRFFKPEGKKIIYANLVSAGVLFSAGLVHLLGEVVNNVKEALPGDYAWGYFFCGLAFYFIFASERMIIYVIMHRRRDHSHSAACHQPDRKLTNNSFYDSNGHTIAAPLDPIHEHLDSKCSSQNMTAVTPDPEENYGHISSEDGGRPQEIQCVTPVDVEDSMSQKSPCSSPKMASVELSKDCEADAGHHHGADITSLLEKQNIMSAFILLFGLGLHSILAGFALGASQESKTVLSLGIAICAHKYLAAFAFGCPLYKSDMSLRTSAAVALFFSLLTPFGMAVGWIAGEAFEGYVSDIFVCLTAGTFLYVSVCEIMIPEFSHDHSLMKKKEANPFMHECCKLLAVILGYGVMSMMAIWV